MLFTRIFRLIFMLLLLSPAMGWSQDTTHVNVADSLFRFSPDRPLRVAVKSTPPFIMIGEDGTYDGLSISLWEKVARRLDLEYHYVPFDDLSDLLKAVEDDRVDVAINPLTVTPERMERMNFTQPFFITNLAISSATQSGGSIGRFLRNLISVQFFMAVALLALVILIFGAVTWFFERRHHEHEFSNDVKGLWDAFWWSAVTMTTVGYGDKAPKSTGGRAVALVWMFTAVIIISGFTASIASSLTVDNLKTNINSVEDLKTAKTVAVDASSATDFLDFRKIRYATAATTTDALEALAQGKYDAFVYDEPIMRYQIMQLDLGDKVSVAPAKFVTQYYAFAMPYAYENATPALNLAIINTINSNAWRAELSRYQLE